jgi:hypothetical protein
LSANPFPICFAMRRFKGLAPNLGSYPLSASHSLTWLSMERVILLSSKRFWSSFILISTMSRRAEVDRRLKTINSCQKVSKRLLSMSMFKGNVRGMRHARGAVKLLFQGRWNKDI